MIFWTIAGLVTLITIGITIYPVFGSGQAPGSALDFDKEVYKARLREIEEERRLGTIDEKRYEYALAEEGRRFLALANTSSAPKSQLFLQSGKPAQIGAIFVIIVIPAVALGGYYQWGSLNSPDQPLQARLEADPSGQSVEILLQRAESQLIKNPDDGRGWLVIAPVYMRLGRSRDAVQAYRNAIRILGPTSELQTSLGEALTVSAGGVVPEEANELFRQASKANPDNIKPLFFIALAFNQAGEFKKAVTAWNDLIAKSPDNAPWLKIARQQLQLAQGKLGTKLPENPTTRDSENAKQPSVDESQDFINSMVERLAGELEENPLNKPGWQRIIRSYTVLDRKSDALAAINKAQQLFKDDKEFIRELEQNKSVLNP